jgi:hypothetical protein
MLEKRFLKSYGSVNRPMQFMEVPLLSYTRKMKNTANELLQVSGIDYISANKV